MTGGLVRPLSPVTALRAGENRAVYLVLQPVYLGKKGCVHL